MTPAGRVIPALDGAQDLAVGLRGRDLLVTAGAGTGKTTVLVERILRHLREGWVESLDELLVVTFTEKAAREMRQRIYRGLRDEPALRRFLPHLPRAAISTIHGFCARFLRERFLEAEIEPGFRVLDENGADQAIDDALRRVFHDWYRHEDRELRTVFQDLVEMAGFDREGESLRVIVRRLYEYARATEDPGGYLERLRARAPAGALEELPWWEEVQRHVWGGWREGLPVEGVWRRGLRLYEAAIACLERSGDDRTRKMRGLLDALRAVPAEELRAIPRQEDLRRHLEAQGFLREGEGFAPRWPMAPGGANEKVPGFRELHEAAKKAFQHPLVAALPWRAAALLAEDAEQCRSARVLAALVADLDAAYTRSKERHGYLDFSDLEVRTLRALRRQGEALRGRYREILVDEFQDVNGLQNEILTRLAAPRGLFRVGDVKQSIYQFRLADPTIFLALVRSRPAARRREEAPEGAGPVAVLLGKNHRSRSAILRFANRIFAQLFDAATIGTPYADQALVPGRAEAKAEAPVELHLIEKPEEPGAAAGRQARFTARRLKRLILEERPLVVGADGRERPASWRDAAILLRARTHAQEYLDAMRAEGIPAYLGAGGSLLEAEPVRDLRALLSVIDNPRDDVALAAALRSPLFALSDSDLLRVRLARPEARTFLDAVAAAAWGDDAEAEGEDFRPRSLREVLSGPPSTDGEEWVSERLAGRLRAAGERIRGWRRAHGRLELPRFLTRVIEESGLAEAMRAAPDFRARLAAVGKFVDLARAYEEERGPSLRGFLARLEALEASGGIDAVADHDAEDDAVALLTMHKAKGLEFPFVVLPGLERSGARRDRLGQKIRLGPEWIGTRTLDPKQWTQRDSVARRLLEQTQAEAEQAEEMRILYVALTRARERLILIGAPGRKASRWLEEVGGPPAPPALTAERLRGSRAALDWIAAALAAPGESCASIPLSIERHAAQEIPDAGSEAPTPAVRPRRVPGLRPPRPAGREAAAELDAILERASRMAPAPPFAALEGLRGKYWVTELKSLADAARRESLRADDGAEMMERLAGAGVALGEGAVGAAAASRAGQTDGATAGAGTSAGAAAAAQRGIAYHAALARFDLSRASPEGIAEQLDAFASSRWWGGAERDPRLEAGLARFFGSDPGLRLRQAAVSGRVEREVSFTLRSPVTDLLPLLASVRTAIESDPRWRRPAWREALAEAWVVVQGRVDCVFREDDGPWCLLDWKTDRVDAAGAVARAAGYAWQMKIYRQAVERLWGPAGEAWLVFLAAGEAVPFPSLSRPGS